MDDLDRKILNLLIENGKMPYRKIASMLHVSPATAMSRVKSMEKAGIIRKYTIMPDYDKMGFGISVVIEMCISKGKLFEVEKKIATHSSVYAVYDITGASDAIVLANFRTRHELDSFLKRIQAYDFVERTETKLILNKMKEENMKI